MSLKAFFLRSVFWFKDRRKGSPIGVHYRELKRTAQNSALQQELQQKRLKDLLDYATTKTSFYASYKNHDLKDFPIVNKKILIDNHDAIKVPESENPYQPAGMSYHIQKTSGSTGTPFAIPQDFRKRMRRIAELKHFGDVVGFLSHDTLIHLRIWTKWQSKTKSQAFWENIYPFDISNLNDEHLAELSETINKVSAKCLRGYASSFDLFAKYVEKHPAKFPTLKLIIAGAETLYDSTRELVHKHLGCEIISQYANEENGILAQELPGDSSRRFYINHDGYIFEVLKFDKDEPAEFGEIGRIVLTDLFNYAFPVIRYDNGDSCILEKDPTTGEICISKLFGRRLDMVYNSKNEPVFPMTLARILKNYDFIRQWQFIQNSTTSNCLKLCVTSDNAAKDYEPEILKQLSEIFGEESNIIIEHVDDIPILQSGKRKCVVNNSRN